MFKALIVAEIIIPNNVYIFHAILGEKFIDSLYKL